MRSGRSENGERVRSVLASGRLSLLQRREVRGTLREVFLTGDGYVVKRYTHGGPPPRFRRPWVLEHRALSRLRGQGAPAPVGYLVDKQEGTVQATLVRRYVEGKPVGGIDRALASEIAALLARFHAAGVTTDDAHRHNFIHDSDGDLVFLDFGRARTFGRRNPLLLAGVAVDLHRFNRATLKRDAGMWDHFLEEYFRRSPFGAVGNRILHRLIAFDMWRYRKVRGRSSR